MLGVTVDSEDNTRVGPGVGWPGVDSRSLKRSEVSGPGECPGWGGSVSGV